jgi:hypothetical protein
MMNLQSLPDATFAIRAIELEFVPVNPAIHGPMDALVATLSFSRSVQKSRWDLMVEGAKTARCLREICATWRCLVGLSRDKCNGCYVGSRLMTSN